MAQNEVVRSVISYHLHNKNKDVIIFRCISTIGNRGQKRKFYDSVLFLGATLSRKSVVKSEWIDQSQAKKNSLKKL